MLEIDRAAARRYFLGEVTETEREALELRFFEDEALAEEVEISENELVDQYVAGLLPSGEGDRFEKAYLSSPDRVAKVQFARALSRRLSSSGTGRDRRPSVSWLLAAAALSIALAGGYLAFQAADARREVSRLLAERGAAQQRERDLRRQLESARSGDEKLRRELTQVQAEKDRLAAELAAREKPEPGLVSFALVAGLVRDASSSQQVFTIPPGARQARLSMSLPAGDYASLSAVIRTPEGREVWKQAALAARPVGSTLPVAVTVPARLLASGDYILTLTGNSRAGRSETLADYVFRVKSH
jgi:hypothetical protein